MQYIVALAFIAILSSLALALFFMLKGQRAKAVLLTKWHAHWRFELDFQFCFSFAFCSVGKWAGLSPLAFKRDSDKGLQAPGLQLACTSPNLTSRFARLKITLDKQKA